MYTPQPRHLGFGSLVTATEGTLEKSSTTEDSGSSSEITGPLLVLDALEAFLMFISKRRLALDLWVVVGDVSTSLGRIDDSDGQRDGALGLAVIVIKIELALEGLAWGIVSLEEWNASEADGLITQSLRVEDLNEELLVTAGVVVIEHHGLIPFDILASVLLDRSLLGVLRVFEIKQETGIGVVLAEALNWKVEEEWNEHFVFKERESMDSRRVGVGARCVLQHPRGRWRVWQRCGGSWTWLIIVVGWGEGCERECVCWML